MVFDSFFWIPLLAGLILSLMAVPLGCFVVWNRMAYFGDTMAHSTLLGVALGLFLGINVFVGVFAIILLIAILLILILKKGLIFADTALGVLSHGAFAMGLIALYLTPGSTARIQTYLLGDILSVNYGDLFFILALCIIILAIVTYQWRLWLSLAFYEEVVQAENQLNTLNYFYRILSKIGFDNIKVAQQMLFIILLALVQALALQLVGVLMMTALLIIPAACARPLAKTPEQQVLMAILIGALSVIGGFLGAFMLNFPPAPSIVLASFILFLVINFLKWTQSSFLQGR